MPLLEYSPLMLPLWLPPWTNLCGERWNCLRKRGRWESLRKVTVQVGSIFQTSMTMEDILQVEVIQQQTMFFFHCWNFLECSLDRHFWTWERWFWSLVKLKHPRLTHGSASTNQSPTCQVEKPTVYRNSMLTVYMQDPFIYNLQW